MKLSNLSVQIAAAATAPLLPFVWRQAQHVREEVAQLSGAAGPCTGEVDGTGLPIRLLVFGASTVAGVGVPDHRQGVTGQVAQALSRQTGRPVRWRAHGQRGLTAQAAHESLLPTLPKASFHAAVVVLGVEDVMQFHGPMQWQRDLGRLVAGLRARTDHPPVVLAGMPPIGRFPALPQPLRTVLGWRGWLFDQAARNFARSTRAVTHVTTALPEDGEGLCSDGFHLSAAGCAAWGTPLARAAVKALQRRR